MPTESKAEFAALRRAMVAHQIEGRGVRAPLVLAAMRKVPREEFVPPDLRQHAYDDGPVSIGAGQTISQPFIVGYMLEAMELRPADRVLEIGTGSGYSAALLAEIVAEVHTVERIAALADAARERLRRQGYTNVHVHCGDGTLGHAAAAPYDAIVVTAGGPKVPESLRHQLAPGGRLVMPVGPFDAQELVRVRALPGGDVHEALTGVRFVPLIGDEGWHGRHG